MEIISQTRSVYRVGTLSGNPVAKVAGLAALGALERRSHAKLEATSRLIQAGLSEAASAAGVDVKINGVGSIFGLCFVGEQVNFLS